MHRGQDALRPKALKTEKSTQETPGGASHFLYVPLPSVGGSQTDCRLP
jgi:hypothetical protein